MKSYFEHLSVLCKDNQVDLASAFKFAGIPYSTYYRNMRGTELRYSTALKVLDAVDIISKHKEVYKKCLVKKNEKEHTTKKKYLSG